MASEYRPDIDGLRTVAVLSVVIFHAFPSLLHGGFVGVDVFFVISGFLISSIILSGSEAGTFSFKNFYIKRINRICPALIAVLIAVYAFGWFALLPEEYEALSKHIMGGVTFISNFVLLRESGYFDVRAAAKPLLHLWSLAIEEQFYIVWPLLLVATFCFARKLVPVLIVAIIALSFVYNISMVQSEPRLAFYSPISRAWELLAGALLAYVQRKGRVWPSFAVQTQSISGFVLLLASIVGTPDDAAFPGLWAIPPVVGAFFLISAGPEGIINRILLANRPMVLVGRTSYPLYLWHWPLLSFAGILQQDTPSAAIRLGAVVIAVAFAWLTYQVIERPARSGRWPRRTAILCVTTLTVLAIVSAIIFHNRGLPDRAVLAEVTTPKPWQDSMDASGSKCPFVAGTYKDCYLFEGKGNEDVLLIGDSHAGHLVPGIAATPAGIKFGAMILNGGCPPLLGLERLIKHQPKPMADFGKSGMSCAQINEARLDYAIRSSAKVVMLSMLTTGYGRPDKPGEFRYSFDGKPGPRFKMIAEGLRRTVDRLTAAGKITILIEDNPTFRGYNFRKCVVQRPLKLPSHPALCRRPRALGIEDNLRISKLYEDARLRRPDLVVVFKTLPILCPTSSCSLIVGDAAMYRDSGHLSVKGSELIMRNFAPRIAAIIARSKASLAPIYTNTGSE